jgi:hypothetical protein
VGYSAKGLVDRAYLLLLVLVFPSIEFSIMWWRVFSSAAVLLLFLDGDDVWIGFMLYFAYRAEQEIQGVRTPRRIGFA